MPRLDIHKIPMDDPAVFAMLACGETKGIFQLESPGMTGLLMRLKPTCLEHIIACIALYRPGPLDAGMVDEYVAVKNGEKKATYVHPAMEKILGYTYGVMVYQEQVMQVLNQVGGIPLSESYSCIKAISKKIKEKVEKYKPMFIAGCVKNGVDGIALWEQIGTFARYGFNKSHSTAYAFIGYQTAWLKQYFPLDFMAALLSCDIDQRNFTGRDSLCEHLEDCYRMGIEVVMPDVSTCGADFQVHDGKIYFGLAAVKGISWSAARAIAAAQPFIDLFDFCSKVPKSECPRATIRNLIRIGAMPGGQTRAVQEATLDRAMKLAQGEYKRPEAQTGKWEDVSPVEREEELKFERAVTGVFISGHPIDNWPWIRLLNNVRSVDTEDITLIGGVITTVETKLTHSGKQFLSFVVDSDRYSTECVCWYPRPDHLRAIQDGRVVIIRGRANRRGSNNTVTVMSVRHPNEYIKNHKLGVMVDLSNQLDKVDALKILLKLYPGDGPVAVRVEENIFRNKTLHVDLTRNLITNLEALVGPGRVYILEGK